MFLSKLSHRLVTSVATPVFRVSGQRFISGHLKKIKSNLIDEWKQKLIDLNVPEIEASMEYIVEHVVGRDKVR